jgi:prepilin-type N-terminal cleavage/methylation domain-containing protein
MNKCPAVANLQQPPSRRRERLRVVSSRRRPLNRGFTLVEVMVVLVLLSLIVLALMAVFSSTQTAFRASVTQSAVLENSRAAMDLMAADVRNLTASGGVSNAVIYFPGNNNYNCGLNFFVADNPPNLPAQPNFYRPLVQALPASSQQRTNLLQWFFILGRRNTQWTGAGYVVNSGSTSPLYPLYRFYAEANIHSDPYALFNAFATNIYYGHWTNMSHLADGVLHLVVRAYDFNGYWMTNTYQYYAGQWHTNVNVWFMSSLWGEVNCAVFSNTLPTAVQMEMGVLEDRTLERAESIPVASARNNYLAQHAAQVHLFRQRVTIPNVDPSLFQ